MLFIFFSAGVGRTGTFIVMDSLLEMLKDNKDMKLNIFKYVQSMREQRVFIVQAKVIL